jgi:hypothetical protein
MNDESNLSFIFFLTFDERLPKAFYKFNEHLKNKGFVLVPVKFDQLQSLISSSGQEQVIVLCSVSDVKEFKAYNQKVRSLLKFILKSKRLTFIHLCSFSKLNDQKKFSLQKNYFFMKYPLSAKELSQTIVKFHQLKNDQKTVWPGGRRATLEGGVL